MGYLKFSNLYSPSIHGRRNTADRYTHKIKNIKEKHTHTTMQQWLDGHAFNFKSHSLPNMWPVLVDLRSVSLEGM